MWVCSSYIRAQSRYLLEINISTKGSVFQISNFRVGFNDTLNLWYWFNLYQGREKVPLGYTKTGSQEASKNGLQSEI